MYIHEQLDGAEAGDDRSDASSDLLTMAPARDVLSNTLTRNTGLDADADTANDRNEDDGESTASSDNVLMMLPAKKLHEKLEKMTTNNGQ